MSRVRFTPRTEANAFRIWAHCQPLGWNTTVAEIATALSLTAAQVTYVVGSKNWTHRLRTVRRDEVFIPANYSLPTVSLFEIKKELFNVRAL